MRSIKSNEYCNFKDLKLLILFEIIYVYWDSNLLSRDVEAIEYFLLPLPASILQRLKVLRFHKNLIASTASSFRFHFYIPAPCFMKNASASGSSRSKCFRACFRFQLISSKCFHFHKKFNRFRFQLPLPHP